MRVAFITGASSGIGLAIAKSLADTFRVVLSSSNLEKLSRASDLIRKHIPAADLLPLQADVTDTGQVDAAVAAAIKHFGDINVLVNCAGISGGGVTQDFPESQWTAMVETNLTGVFRVTTAVLRASGMSKQRWGRIVNIASTAGKQGVMLAAAYSATKHGVVGFTKSLGLELAKTGITVNAICPGFVDTPMAATTRENYARRWQSTVEEIKQHVEQRVPLGRYVDAEEVASLARYLVSDEAGAIVGQAFNVCGGLGQS